MLYLVNVIIVSHIDWHKNESLVELFSQYDDIDFSIADAQGDEKKTNYTNRSIYKT